MRKLNIYNPGVSTDFENFFFFVLCLDILFIFKKVLFCIEHPKCRQRILQISLIDNKVKYGPKRAFFKLQDFSLKATQS